MGAQGGHVAQHRIGEDWVIERLDRLWPAHTAAFTRFLIALRNEFDDDLDAVLLLGAVATGTRGHGWQEILLGEGTTGAVDHSPTNTQSIAHVTAIPRESVRRKLARLEAKGWVTRDPEGNWKPTAQAANDLGPATRATIAYLRTVFAVALADPPSSADSRTSSADF